MARVLCLDTEPETLDYLRSRGHEVLPAQMGYRTGIRHVITPPHEADAIVCDLKKPACFDHSRWGPGANDNFQCTLVEPLTEEIIRYEPGGREVPRYSMIYDTQIEGPRQARAPGTFGPEDVARAIYTAGIPVLLFLNREWLVRVEGSSPNLVGLTWEFRRTTAHRLTTEKAFVRAVPEVVYGPLQWRTPVEFCIVGGPRVPAYLPLPSPRLAETKFQRLPLVWNAIGETFGEALQFGQGRIWLLPASVDNAALIDILLNRLYALQDIPFAPPEPASEGSGHQGTEPAPPRARTVTPASAIRDIFVSYASDDKNVAQPLADALRDSGLSVWFDEYELRVGDSLSRKIDEGLRISRHGVVVLSHNFFAKNWPQQELAGLRAQAKKILPVWHELSAEQVKQYSPTLADVYATDTSLGLDRVVKVIREAMDREDLPREHTPRTPPARSHGLRGPLIIEEADQIIEMALQSGGTNETWVVAGARMERQDPQDAWTLPEIDQLSAAAYRCIHGLSAPSTDTKLIAFWQETAEIKRRVEFYNIGVILAMFGWNINPFPVEAAILGLRASVDLVKSKEVWEVYRPVVPIEMSLGVVSWPNLGISSKTILGTQVSRPIGTTAGRRFSRRYTLDTYTDSWSMIGPFITLLLTEAGYRVDPASLSQPPADALLMRSAYFALP